MSCEAREAAQAELKWLHETDIAVVVSQGQNEIADMAAKGLDIRPHRERMVREDLDEKFKAPADPLRLVFVCAMWITGIDVPTCSTVYLDKPMKNHTLMQTEKVRALREDPERKARVQRVADEIEALLDEAILGIDITAPVRSGDDMEGLFDISQIDFDKLRERFAHGQKRTQTQKLRTAIERKLEELAAQNPTRSSLVERFQELIAEYNAAA